VIGFEIKKTPDNHHVSGRLLLQIGYAFQRTPQPNRPVSIQHVSSSSSSSATSEIHRPMLNVQSAPNQTMWPGETSAPINNTTFPFPVPRPPLTQSASTSAIPSHPNMPPAPNPGMPPHPMNAQVSHPMNAQAPHPSVRVNEALARHVSVRRQNTISRPLDSREMSLAREQVARRSLGDSDEPPITPSDPLGPLPPGWHARTAPDGRTYFSDSKYVPDSLQPHTECPSTNQVILAQLPGMIHDEYSGLLPLL
jgi:hypothetical protein